MTDPNMDKVITQELLFGNVVYPVKEEEEEFTLLLWWIAGAYLSGKSYSVVHARILENSIAKNTETELVNVIKSQGDIILGNKSGNFDRKKELFTGQTIYDMVKARREGINKRILVTSNQLRDLVRSGQIKQFKATIRDSVRRFKVNTNQFWETATKAGREQYRKQEELGERDIKGWISIAVLDARTSVICASLHDKTYLKPEYRTRSAIPNLPPRHPNCRSIVVPMRQGFSEQSYKEQTIDTFFKRNPRLAKEFMGQAKYQIWVDSGDKLKSYFDAKRNRFYTNDQILRINKRQ